MGNFRDRNIDSSRRDDQRAGTIDICVVTHVYPHVHPWPDDVNFNLVDVQLIDRVRDKTSSVAPVVPRIHLKTLLHYHSWLQGEVWNPRIGDAVVVYWIKNREGLVLGQTQTVQQEPVCRSQADDKHQEIVKKTCSWPGYPEVNPDGDFVAYPPPQHPDCFKRWPVGSCEECGGGEEKQYGDTVYVFDCPNGHARPYCDSEAPCTCIDDIHACATYFKYHSAVSPTENELPYRFKFHHHCGSIFYFDEDGTIHLENIIYECASQATRQGQIHFEPTGTIWMRSEPETEKAAMVRVVSLDDSDTVRVEMIDETTGAYVRIYKDGEIELYSPTKITLDAPLVEIKHDLQVDEDELVSGTCSGPNNVE